MKKIMEMTQTKANWKKKINSLVFPAVVAVALGSWYQFNIHWKARLNQENASRREAICPALLSISRSARDTLIVMKAEDLCNSFVLDNLK